MFIRLTVPYINVPYIIVPYISVRQLAKLENPSDSHDIVDKVDHYN